MPSTHQSQTDKASKRSTNTYLCGCFVACGCWCIVCRCFFYLSYSIELKGKPFIHVKCLSVLQCLGSWFVAEIAYMKTVNRAPCTNTHTHDLIRNIFFLIIIIFFIIIFLIHFMAYFEKQEFISLMGLVGSGIVPWLSRCKTHRNVNVSGFLVERV